MVYSWMLEPMKTLELDVFFNLVLLLCPVLYLFEINSNVVDVLPMYKH